MFKILTIIISSGNMSGFENPHRFYIVYVFYNKYYFVSWERATSFKRMIRPSVPPGPWPFPTKP